MVSVWGSLVLSFAALSVHAVVPIPSAGKPSFAKTVPNRYIVETANLQNVVGSKRSGSPHESLYLGLRKRGISFDVLKEFNEPNIFVAAVLDISNPNDFKSMSEMDGIESIKPVYIISRPRPINLKIVSHPEDASLPDSESTHVMTGVDKAHALGFTGKGVKIGILDTGVDYYHPSLGGGFGAGFKVAGGYDFVGDNFTGNNSPVPDNDPLDTCAGHGTHVAGIIGANPGNTYNISGVSYDATLYAYRIFGCLGSTPDDVIIEALLRAYNDGTDIMNLSLGGPSGFVESSSAIVASRIAGMGRVVTIAAGNDGSTGSWYASGPGTGINVISVASVDNIVTPIQNATVFVNGNEAPPIPYLSPIPLNVTGGFPVYATSTNTSIVNDACSPLPDSTPDLSSFLVVIRRGTCPFVQKLSNAAAKGASKFLIYNNVGGFASIGVGNYTAALIEEDSGSFLVNKFAAGDNITVSFENRPFNSLNDISGGLVSSFSSYGPSYDMFFKPAVAAPGGIILSTYLLNKGSWALLSGTSMATPFVAGSAALVFQAKGVSAAVGRGMRDLFQSTAVPVSSSLTDGGSLQTLTQAGAGILQVNRAIGTETIVSPGQLTLNDTANFRSVQEFTIENTGSSVVTYNLKHVPAGTASTIKDEVCAVGPVPLTTTYASVGFSQSSVTVPPGHSVPVLAIFEPPSGIDKSTYPVFSGFIEATSDSETLRVSYTGVAASLKDKVVLDTTSTYFGVPVPFLQDSNGKLQSNATNYTFVGTDVPTLYLRLLFGTPVLQVDLVSSDFDQSSLSIQGSGLIGTLASWPYIPRNSDVQVDAANNGFNEFAFNSMFANGTDIPKGSYRTLVRALKVTGNPDEEGDYESWLSPIVVKSE